MELEGGGLTNEHNATDADLERGWRAEEVAQWYFRLNGFFLIPGFIVHPDARRRTPRTEADMLGIRLKGSTEGIWRKRSTDHFSNNGSPTPMKDHVILTAAGKVGMVSRHLVAMVEVKAGQCAINGPWSDRSELGRDSGQSNMERALARIGFGNRIEVSQAAEAMYDELRYEGAEFVVQYFAVGRTFSTDLAERYPKLIQISFDQIGTFLNERFSCFPEKIPTDRDIALWQGFGDSFRWWFEGHSNPDARACQAAVKRFIDVGRCHK